MALLSHRGTDGMRLAPSGIWVHGPAGVGKSLLAATLRRAAATPAMGAASVGAWCEQEEEEEKMDRRRITSWHPT